MCITEDTYCGGNGNDNSCSCDASCVANGNCCGDYAPVCAGQFQCAPDTGQIAFLHVGGMCSEKWDYANDPAMAESVGVRAAHGEAPFQKLVRGKRYKVLLRSSGGLTFAPEDLPPEALPGTL